MSITIVGLGPGDGRYLTRQAWEVLSSATVAYVRTRQHPAVAELPDTLRIVSFDRVYDSAASFDEVYEEIASQILRLGRRVIAESRPIVYAVPGDPCIGESTVSRIQARAKSESIPVTLVPGVSFIEPTLHALGLDGLGGLQLFDAVEVARYHHPPFSTDMPLLLGQVYNRFLASDLKLALMAVYPDEHEVILVHAAGTASQSIEHLPLYAIDRSKHLAHLTSLLVPALSSASTVPALAEVVAHLRSAEGCPWDREQTAQSLRPGFLEETNEVLAALDADDPVALCEELGDVLFHLVMQAQIASEEGAFRLTEVVSSIIAKLKRRHPHVWGDWEVADSAEVIHNWEVLKANENQAGSSTSSLLANIPVSLPALARSQKIQERVQRIGFDWPALEGVTAKVDEELNELKAANTVRGQRHELGDVLFVLVNWARWLGVDAESALREANMRFESRFQRLEQLAAERDLVLEQIGLSGLNALWDEAKTLEPEAD